MKGKERKDKKKRNQDKAKYKNLTITYQVSMRSLDL